MPTLCWWALNASSTASHSQALPAVCESWDQLSSGQWTKDAATTSCRAVQKTWAFFVAICFLSKKGTNVKRNATETVGGWFLSRTLLDMLQVCHAGCIFYVFLSFSSFGTWLAEISTGQLCIKGSRASQACDNPRPPCFVTAKFSI